MKLYEFIQISHQLAKNVTQLPCYCDVSFIEFTLIHFTQSLLHCHFKILCCHLAHLFSSKNKERLYLTNVIICLNFGVICHALPIKFSALGTCLIGTFICMFGCRDTGDDADSQGDGSSQPDTISIASRTSQNTVDSDKVQTHRSDL